MITLSTILVGVESGRRFIPKFNDWLMEKVFHKVSRPHERFQINSATYYVWGLFLMVMLFPKEACLLGVLTLGFGDPIASIVGQRYGKIKIFKEKSLEGALAFWLAGFAICLIYQLIYIPQIPLLDIIKISSIVAFVGALTELFTIKIDDNFSIPVISALVASFLLVGYGIY